MKTMIHKAEERGNADYGWLKTNYSFSFANYYNPERMGFGALRVINDDKIAPGQGFSSHPHDNMEIVTLVLSGSLKHKDSQGHEGLIQPGDVQIMSAGTGIVHSEFNASNQDGLELLQIWVLPKVINIKPRYQQKQFSLAEKNIFHTLVSPDKDGENLWINQDAYFSWIDLEEGKKQTYTMHDEGYGVYIFVVSGQVQVEGQILSNRDALQLSAAKSFVLTSVSASNVLLIEIPL